MRVTLEVDGEEFEASFVREGETVKVHVGGETFEAKLVDPGHVTLGGVKHAVRVGDHAVTLDGREIPFRILDLAAAGGPGDAQGGARGARVRPPMPGKIVSIAVNEGDEVKPGQVLLILEAMKMQNEVPSPGAGVVKKVHVRPGQNVEGKDVLLEIE